ncbi:ABC transporter substrate-binding protein [Patescibacteria group bacterium]|nr:ABC transporter substrate-binding protein [Patescibacteria group bacterium]
MKNIIWVLVAVVVLGGLAWFATSKKDTGPSAPITVGISQITSHPVFDMVISGIKEGFANAGYVEGETITYDIQNAQGDNSANAAIAQKFASSGYDIFMPLGTPASQAVVNLIKDSPIVFGAVTDPVTAGLVVSNEAPGANVTGTSDITLYREHLELLKKLVPTAKKIGIVYNPGEANARFALEQAQKYAKEFGFEIITAPANTGTEVNQAARSLVSKIDAFYMLPDNTVVAAQESLIKVALDGKKPLISLDESGVEKGALATLGTNYKYVGVRTAEIAIRVLNGEAPAGIPVLGVTDADVFLNTTTAKMLGVTIPGDVLASAKKVYE